jgi:hypothetical protein
LEIFFGKIFYIAVFIRNVSFTAIANGRYRSAGDVAMFSSISGSESIDMKNLSQNIKPDLKKGSKREYKWPVEPRNSQGDLHLATKPRTCSMALHF